MSERRGPSRSHITDLQLTIDTIPLAHHRYWNRARVFLRPDQVLDQQTFDEIHEHMGRYFEYTKELKDEDKQSRLLGGIALTSSYLAGRAQTPSVQFGRLFDPSIHNGQRMTTAAFQKIVGSTADRMRTFIDHGPSMIDSVGSVDHDLKVVLTNSNRLAEYQLSPEAQYMPEAAYSQRTKERFLGLIDSGALPLRRAKHLLVLFGHNAMPSSAVGFRERLAFRAAFAGTRSQLAAMADDHAKYPILSCYETTRHSGKSGEASYDYGASLRKFSSAHRKLTQKIMSSDQYDRMFKEWSMDELEALLAETSFDEV